jgi:hypothetical protein
VTVIGTPPHTTSRETLSPCNFNTPTMAFPQVQLPPLSIVTLPPLPHNPPTHEDFARAIRYVGDIDVARSQSAPSSLPSSLRSVWQNPINRLQPLMLHRRIFIRLRYFQGSLDPVSVTPALIPLSSDMSGQWLAPLHGSTMP